MTTFFIYDRWGSQIGTLQNIAKAVHAVEVNGEDSLTLEVIGDALAKGQRIVWRDKFNVWHEHIVSEIEVRHEDEIITTAYCENSISEIALEYIVDKNPSGSATALMNVALANSRWTTGTVSVSGSYKTSWYHISAYEALQDVVSLFNAEISTSITVSGSSISSRRINIVPRIGLTTPKRFTYGRNLSGIVRTVESDDVVTALYGYGKGLPNYDDDGEATGGYSRKITFGDINGGKDYVTNETAKAIWGIPDGKGGINHAWGKVEFDDCEDPKELLTLTKAALEKMSKPTVTYEGAVISFGEAGFTNGEDSQVGDDVFIRDKELGEKLSGRVLRYERDLLDATNDVITLGNIVSTINDSVKGVQKGLADLRNRSANWNGVAEANQAWLQNMMDNLNTFMNEVGGYAYWEQGQGITVYNKPVDKNPTMAIQLNGAGFRIANSKKSNGDWNWTTFGTGDGFTANCINVGKLKCGTNSIDLDSGTVTFKYGTIQDTGSKNFWDLGTGEFRMATTAKVGTATSNQTLANYTKAQGQAAVDAQTQKSIFDKLTDNGKTQGIYLSDGKVYINGSYIKTGAIDAKYITTGYITDKYGRSKWDLDAGTFVTNSMTANNITANGTFSCGSTYGIKLDSTGKMAGFYNNRQVGYIDYSGSMRDITTNVLYYGLQLQGGCIRISTPLISVARSSSTSTITTHCYTGSNRPYISYLSINSSGGGSWTTSYASFINGYCIDF